MENDKPGGDQEKPLESKRLSFFESWQKRLGLNHELSPEDEEDSQEADKEKKDSKKVKNSKKWQSLFGKVFGGIVKPTPVEATPAEDKTNKTEKLTDNAKAPSSLPEVQTTLDQETVTADIPGEESVELMEPPDTDAEKATEGEISIDHSNDKILQSPPTKTDLEHDIPEEVHEDQQSFDVATSKNKATWNQAEAGAFPAEQIKSPEPRERVIERNGRGVGVAAGLFGLEFFGRKRADRKLKKEIERLDTEFKKREYETSPIVNKNETIRSDNNLLNQRLHPEINVSAPENLAAVGPEKLISKTERKLSKTQETAPKTNTEREPPTQESQLSKKEKPEKILEKVLEAAENNVPIEKLYERRHEVKDEPSQTVGAAPVSAILTGSGAEQSMFKAATQQFIDSQKTTPKSPFSDQPEAYIQAVKNGFCAAVVLVIIAAIFLVSDR